MSKIFCLQTEYVVPLDSLGWESYEKSMLDFLYTNRKFNGIERITYRSVCCLNDLQYYIGHLRRKEYDDTNIVLFLFNGNDNHFKFPQSNDESSYTLRQFADLCEGLFKDRAAIVHFGCAYTLGSNDADFLYFKNKSQAQMVTWYEQDLYIPERITFDTWIVDTISRHHYFEAQEMKEFAQKQVPYFVSKFNFKAY